MEWPRDRDSMFVQERKTRAVLIVPQDRSWIGATLTAGSQPVGALTAGNAEYVYLPLGRYVLSIDEPGGATVKVDLNVPDGTLPKRRR